MRIVLAGGTGFLGRALRRRLHRPGHEVTVLTRRPGSADQAQRAWTPDGTVGAWAAELKGADAIINLAGEGIGDRRWNAARKKALLDSRVLATRSLVGALRQVAPPPAVLINASGIGYYGDRGDEVVTEATGHGDDFLAHLCLDWEREAEQASATSRVVIVRSALVLHPDGGALAQMLTPFRFGVGGPVGSGRQYMPWIHLDDWVSLVVWLLTTREARGAFNAVAPTPVTNRAFSHALGRALHRPSFMPVPAFALRVLFGELAESLLTGQRAIPARASELGFTFRFEQLDAALRDLFP